LPTDDAFLM